MSIILLLNLLIAMMGQTYESTMQYSEIEWRVGFARRILLFEILASAHNAVRSKKKQFRIRAGTKGIADDNYYHVFRNVVANSEGGGTGGIDASLFGDDDDTSKAAAADAAKPPPPPPPPPTTAPELAPPGTPLPPPKPGGVLTPLGAQRVASPPRSESPATPAGRTPSKLSRRLSNLNELGEGLHKEVADVSTGFSLADPNLAQTRGASRGPETALEEMISGGTSGVLAVGKLGGSVAQLGAGACAGAVTSLVSTAPDTTRSAARGSFNLLRNVRHATRLTTLSPSASPRRRPAEN